MTHSVHTPPFSYTHTHTHLTGFPEIGNDPRAWPLPQPCPDGTGWNLPEYKTGKTLTKWLSKSYINWLHSLSWQRPLCAKRTHTHTHTHMHIHAHTHTALTWPRTVSAGRRIKDLFSAVHTGAREVLSGQQCLERAFCVFWVFGS